MGDILFPHNGDNEGARAGIAMFSFAFAAGSPREIRNPNHARIVVFPVSFAIAKFAQEARKCEANFG
ncbi:MAG: hypothetical protein HY056_06385 [Proteobacteria bacterium]|nr:hypothetical protein [Pseudomonadota bacterium]